MCPAALSDQEALWLQVRPRRHSIFAGTHFGERAALVRNAYSPRPAFSISSQRQKLSFLPAGAGAERVAGGASALGPEARARAIRHRRWRTLHARRSRPRVRDRREPRSGQKKCDPERVHRCECASYGRATKAFGTFVSRLLTCRPGLATPCQPRQRGMCRAARLRTCCKRTG